MEYVMVLIVSLANFIIMGVYPDEKTCKTAFDALNVGITKANPDIQIGCFSFDDAKKAMDEAKKRQGVKPKDGN